MFYVIMLPREPSKVPFVLVRTFRKLLLFLFLVVLASLLVFPFSCSSWFLQTLDNGMRIIQLETAVGAAMKNFEGAHGINVPRRRFLPVKTCSDLLIIMSNLYEMKHGQLEMSHLRQFPTVPIVQLSGSHFKKVKDFLARFETIPDLLELDHLTVSGDVTFGKGVSLKGTVIVIANHGDRIDIPSGALLENKIVSGNLRILQH